MRKFDDFLVEQLQDEEFKKEYDRQLLQMNSVSKGWEDTGENGQVVDEGQKSVVYGRHIA